MERRARAWLRAQLPVAEERLPTIFMPVSPPPYANGPAREFLSWVIESRDPEFTPEVCVQSAGEVVCPIQSMILHSGRALRTKRPNPALELTSARTVFSFPMISSFSLYLALALGGRSSACSR